MQTESNKLVSQIPSVDSVMRYKNILRLIDIYGRKQTLMTVREVLDQIRGELIVNSKNTIESIDVNALVSNISELLRSRDLPSLKAVINLTGVVLHSNLGRAHLPKVAINAVADVAGGSVNLEYDLKTGRRGDRDYHVEGLICTLTGAEAATVVNNNAAAVFLTLNTLCNRKEVPVSRGELVEIGGSFRVPDIMKRAGAKLCEVGTTNRTHLSDYEVSISNRTGALMKVHTSNFAISGFTKEIETRDLSILAGQNLIPLIEDLGSGNLIDLSEYGLPYERTVREVIGDGADIVTFSGDKLLGGPQAGIIAGKKNLIKLIKKNPIKRATRLDKMSIAALSSVLRLYLRPEKLVEHSPILKLLTRSADNIKHIAFELLPIFSEKFGSEFSIKVIGCKSQIGSGSLPVELLPSYGISLKPIGKKAGSRLGGLAQAFRLLPVPVVGRIQEGSFILDLRCLEDQELFKKQLNQIKV
ncbi:MAG: L-seryl-tRNA(Sec) selenium transferase [Pseudomonadota bacterium]|nr:L-seryl-tRNA(Sec) selenium transferase [Pseudomonadota bacterium]